MSGAVKHTGLAPDLALAYRTLEYVSLEGEQPEELMDCDLEMWQLAHAVLMTAGKPIPKQQSSSKKWKAAIECAKREAAKATGGAA